MNRAYYYGIQCNNCSVAQAEELLSGFLYIGDASSLKLFLDCLGSNFSV
jgi:hypothetical protein